MLFNKKNMGKIIFSVFAFILIPATQVYPENKQSDIRFLKKTMKQAEKYKKIISAPGYLPDYKQEAAEKLKKLSQIAQSSKLQERIEQYKNTLTGKLNDPAYKTDPDDQKKSANFLDTSERIYIFISSSVPISTLKAYTSDIYSLDDPNISLVMRGFVNGMKYFAPTADFVKSINSNNNANIIIDPLLFRKYGVTGVPAIVYAKGMEVINIRESEGKKGNAKFSQAYLLYGDISLSYAMEQIYKKTAFEKINKIIKKLRGDFY